jgi:galactose-1-phosphate uridylyltransferase
METPSNALYIDHQGKVVVPNEDQSFAAAAEYLRDKDTAQVETFYGLVRQLAPYNRIEGQWRARTFANLTPTLGRAHGLPLCLVQAIHPRHHYTDFHDLPATSVQALVASWQFIEKFAQQEGLLAISFINGGKRPESGQSVACCHAQTYLFDQLPPLFEQIGRRRQQLGHCPICEEVLKGQSIELAIWKGNTVVILAHPSPKRNWSLLIVPRTHTANLHSIDSAEFADALQRCIRAYKRLNNMEPAHNIVVRAGDAVGHLHAEAIPKTETNTLAGLEETTDETIIDVSPEYVREQLQPLMM